MKVETTVSLSEELAAALGKRVEDPEALSQFVEDAIRAHLLRQRRKESSHDLAIINAHADALNAEAEDVLSYQVVPCSTSLLQ
jgi:metal-responsive CopG/Arc/MetJ family transcriptional regulator